MEKYIIKCSCGKYTTYNHKRSYIRALNLGSKCKSCALSIKQGGIGIISIGDLRKCRICEDYKNVTGFIGNKTECFDCRSIRKKFSAKNTRQQVRFRKYGIDQKIYDNLLEVQNNCCAICNKEFGVANIDHCHNTGNVRGLLCTFCNTSLGLLKEDVNIITNMLQYIDKHS